MATRAWEWRRFASGPVWTEVRSTPRIYSGYHPEPAKQQENGSMAEGKVVLWRPTPGPPDAG